MKKRCAWAVGRASMRDYHDREWAVPVHDDRKLFELLVLEGAQAGLSWETILRKRENYRAAFDGFDVEKVRKYTAHDVRKLLADPGIVRNRLKIASAISNARAFRKTQEEFGSFDRYAWSFVGAGPIWNRHRLRDRIPATSRESDMLSRDLKNRGFRFVGSTIVYAFMQAAGLVNDHALECYRHREVGPRRSR